MLRFLLAALLVLSSWPQRVWATSCYVSTTGREALDGGFRLETAFRTFDFAVPRLQAGDTLWVAEGLWTSQDGGSLRISCAESNANANANANADANADAVDADADARDDAPFSGVRACGAASSVGRRPRSRRFTSAP
jgi:hypothetical protein